MKSSLVLLFATSSFGAVIFQATPRVSYFSFGSSISSSQPTKLSTSITYAGSGCPDKSIKQTLKNNEDGNIASLTFSNYEASIGPNTPAHEYRKFCEIEIDIDIPQGYQFSYTPVDYSGVMKLDNGVQGYQSAKYKFNIFGREYNSEVKSEFSGPSNAHFVMKDAIPEDDYTEWSECSRTSSKGTASVRNEIFIQGQESNLKGVISIDDMGQGSQHFYGLAWRKC